MSRFPSFVSQPFQFDVPKRYQYKVETEANRDVIDDPSGKNSRDVITNRVVAQWMFGEHSVCSAMLGGISGVAGKKVVTL